MIGSVAGTAIGLIAWSVIYLDMSQVSAAWDIVIVLCLMCLLLVSDIETTTT